MPATFRDHIRVQIVNANVVMKKLDKMPDALKQAIENSVKKTTAFVLKEVPKMITTRYDISEPSLMSQSHRAGRWKMKPKYVRKGGTIIDGGVEVVGTRMPVMRFHVDPREVPNQRGVPVKSRQVVTVIVRRGHAQTGAPNVFLARMKSGHIGVYRKKPDATHRIRPDGQRTQLNITEEYMLSVPEMVSSKKIRPKLQRSITKFMRDTFMEETEHQGLRYRGPNV